MVKSLSFCMTFLFLVWPKPAIAIFFSRLRVPGGSFLDSFFLNFFDNITGGGFGLFNIWRPLDTYRFRKIRCAAKFLSLNFDVVNFDRYEDFFRSDSVMILPQAGSFNGLKGILEYTAFADSARTPFISQGPFERAASFKVLGLRENGQCEFLGFQRLGYVTNPSISDDEIVFDTTTMVKIYFDFDEGYITEDLSTIAASNYVCNTAITETCAGILDPSTSETCPEQYDALPVTEFEDLYIDGNSKGCRLLHSILALTNPVLHCPHLSFDPKTDPEGQVICQESEQIPIGSVFEQSELDLFRDFQLDNGVNPDVGIEVASD